VGWCRDDLGAKGAAWVERDVGVVGVGVVGLVGVGVVSGERAARAVAARDARRFARGTAERRPGKGATGLWNAGINVPPDGCRKEQGGARQPVSLSLFVSDARAPICTSLFGSLWRYGV
jgi:hypothetical protein